MGVTMKKPATRSRRNPGAKATATPARATKVKQGGKDPNRPSSVGLYAALVVLILLCFLLILLMTRQNPAAPEPVVVPDNGLPEVTVDPEQPYEYPAITGEGTIVPPETQSPNTESKPSVNPEAASRIAPLRIPNLAANYSPKLVVVIDDVGYDIGLLLPFLQASLPMTFAILPELRDSGVSAELLSGSGKEVILHLPMESVGGIEPGAGTLRAGMSDSELLEILERNVATVPYIRGVNNHMGSLGTTDPRILGIVMQYLAQKGYFFLDSVTTVDTIADRLAAEHGVRYLRRAVFLDNSRAKNDILRSLERGLEIAARDGSAVLIGHVWSPELAELLFEVGDDVLRAGFRFTTLADLLSREEGR